MKTEKQKAEWLKNRRNHTRNAKLCLFCECVRCQYDWFVRHGLVKPYNKEPKMYYEEKIIDRRTE